MAHNLTTVNYPYDYQPPMFVIEKTDLVIDINDDYTLITANFVVKKNQQQATELKLTGKNIELLSVAIDSKKCNNYKISKDQLIIPITKDQFNLTIVNKIYPHNNTYLEGIYLSNGIICSQCEATGFRRITYYLDRPDMLSVFTTKIIADKQKFPVLLSNGNLIDQGDINSERHYAYWEDKFKKPCYLFAIVAGNLVANISFHTTTTGRKITLKIFTEPHNKHKCQHAMTALQQSMVWDEQNYGREYDLDLFMIVAIDHFNMGAMENKGLNIFNSECVLASIDTTSDEKFEQIQATVAHEYFHNWSGNRVTCRDWYQLSLKEGFTVFREQQFCADMSNFAIKRIDDIQRLFTFQFPEDSGPLSHSVQPRDYNVSDFYTATIYEKGAELIRMLHLIVCQNNFRKGCDLFFDNFDGKAATCEDFICCLEQAANTDLTQFRLWYFQSGTPRINTTELYDADSQNFQLTIEQSAPINCNDTQHWQPLHIPIKIGFFNNNGDDITHEFFTAKQPAVLHLKQFKQTFIFNNISCKPNISLLRDYSAPVILENNYKEQQMIFQIKHDNNIVNKYLAWNKFTTSLIKETLANKLDSNKKSSWLDTFTTILKDESLDIATKSKLIQLPPATDVIENLAVIEPIKLYDTIKNYKGYLANNNYEKLLSIYNQLNNTNLNKKVSLEYTNIAQRLLKNSCLKYLILSDKNSINELAVEQYNRATNMTDRIASIACLLHSQYFDAELADDLLNKFYQQFSDDANVINQWYALQMQSPYLGTTDKLAYLLKHKSFDKTNPNNWRALLNTFIANYKQFYTDDQSTYSYIAELLTTLDKLNPQTAAKITSKLSNWYKMEQKIKDNMLLALKQISQHNDLSKETLEVVTQLLKKDIV